MTVGIIYTVPHQVAVANCAAGWAATALGMSPVEKATTTGRTEGNADV